MCDAFDDQTIHKPFTTKYWDTLKINCYTLLFNKDIYDLKYGISGIYGISVQDINKS